MFYLDRIHTSAFGARVNAESAAEGIRNYKGLEQMCIRDSGYTGQECKGVV